MTIALFETANTWETGVCEINEDGRLICFTEKPPEGKERSKLSNGGIYILEPEIFKYIPEGNPSDFGYDVLPRLIEENVPIFGYFLGPDTYLIDIGRIEKYNQANKDVNAGKVKILDEE